MALIIFSDGHMTREKLGSVLEFVGNLPELLLVVTWALLVA